jgi:hypothetical protein
MKGKQMETSVKSFFGNIRKDIFVLHPNYPVVIRYQYDNYYPLSAGVEEKGVVVDETTMKKWADKNLPGAKILGWAMQEIAL